MDAWTNIRENDTTMSSELSFASIESAVKSGKVTYKALIAELCKRNCELASELLDDVALTSVAPKIVRKKHRASVVEKYGDDKEAIKAAMKAYDAALPKEDKPKRVPPTPRKLTDEEKEYNKSRNAYVKAEKKKMGDDITISEMKAFVKKCRADYDKKHKKSLEKVVEEEDEETKVETFEDANEDEEAEEPEEAEEAELEVEEVEDEVENKEHDDAKKAAKEARKAAEKEARKAEKDAKKAEEKAAKKAAEKAAKKAAKKAEKE